MLFIYGDQPISEQDSVDGNPITETLRRFYESMVSKDPNASIAKPWFTLTGEPI